MPVELRSASGFSLVELLVAVTVFAIGAGIAVSITASSLSTMRIDGEAQRLMSMLRQGREVAMSNRRDVEVQFDLASHTATILRLETGVATALETVALAYDVQFRQYAATGDTPDGFGAGSAVDFGASTTLRFDADGSLIDETGLPANGTLFLGHGNTPHTARAITVTGTTGRACLYRWMPRETGGAWEVR